MFIIIKNRTMEDPLLVIRGYKFNLDKFNLVTGSTFESYEAFTNGDKRNFISDTENYYFKWINHYLSGGETSSIFVCTRTIFSQNYNEIFDKELFESMFDSGYDQDLIDIKNAILNRIAEQFDDIDLDNLDKIFEGISVYIVCNCKIN
jgi:hypothetical protein